MLFKFTIAFCFLVLIKHRFFWKVPGRLRFTDPKPFLIAHRGFKKSFSENSMGSFLDAQAHGFQWIEIDVISTKDKEVICSHNFDLEKETVGRGYITESNYDTLKAIIAEHNIHIEGENILPKLVDVFKQLDPNIKVNIEVKSSHALDFHTARALSKILKYLPNKRIIVSSFNPFVIFYFKLFHPHIITGFLYQNLLYLSFVNWIHPSYIHPRADLLNDELIRYAKEKNLGVNVWTVNNKPAIDWCRDKKVDGIITDLGVIK
ncbi:MAG: glycerophosphodiester phosphodiesterase [Candidatus Neomarinimicrobiota bacterium]